MCKQELLVPAIDGSDRRFRPDTKCCTYHPKLPNYLVGALLADQSPALADGKRRIREKIAKRSGVGPQWIRPPAKYAVLYDTARKAFGRAESLRCPYFETQTGGCTIWTHREAVCSTYFCRYEAGADGLAMWTQTKEYLALVESQLSRYALLQLFPEFVLQQKDRASPEPLSARDLDDVALPDAAYAKLWGEWAGREEELYGRCHTLVAALSAQDVEHILGIDGKVAVAVLERRVDAATRDVLPDTLTFNPNATVRWLPENVVALGAYSDLDALALDGSAYALLVAFDGTRSVSAVRAALREEKQADLSDAVLLALYRHRVLCE